MPSLELNMPLHTFAPAKINLALKVLGRRSDGYHTLRSIVVFASEGDSLELLPGSDVSLAIRGPFASGLDNGANNLVLKAVRLLQERKEGLRIGSFRLDKRLPVASGIGGGSADAAAALRLVAQVNEISLDDNLLQEAALAAGADVPVCLESRARMMGGIGEMLGDPLGLPKLPAVLVNPGVAVSTPDVFRELGLAPGENRPNESTAELQDVTEIGQLLAILNDEDNDLQEAAGSLAPDIRMALEFVSGTTDCLLARMSGSGATVFGLYPDFDRAESAASYLKTLRPHWWIKPAWLR